MLWEREEVQVLQCEHCVIWFEITLRLSVFRINYLGVVVSVN
jgi:hypothetical protein